MASSKEYLNFVLDQLSGLNEITYRAMMGDPESHGGVSASFSYSKFTQSRIIENKFNRKIHVVIDEMYEGVQ